MTNDPYTHCCIVDLGSMLLTTQQKLLTLRPFVLQYTEAYTL